MEKAHRDSIVCILSWLWEDPMVTCCEDGLRLTRMGRVQHIYALLFLGYGNKLSDICLMGWRDSNGERIHSVRSVARGV